MTPAGTLLSRICGDTPRHLFLAAKAAGHLHEAFVVCMAVVGTAPDGGVKRVNFLLRKAFPFIDEPSNADDKQLAEVRAKLRGMIG